jgi:hypothetical protein
MDLLFDATMATETEFHFDSTAAMATTRPARPGEYPRLRRQVHDDGFDARHDLATTTGERCGLALGVRGRMCHSTCRRNLP